MNPKEFFRRWGEGMKKLTPIQITESKIAGTIGAIIGGIGATITFIWQFWVGRTWTSFFISLVVAGVTFVQYAECANLLKQLETLKQMEDLQKKFKIVTEDTQILGDKSV